MSINASSRNTIIGITVAVFLLGAIYLSRSARAPSVESSVVEGTTGKTAVGGTPKDPLPIGLDVSAKDGELLMGPLVAEVVLTPRPALPMTDLAFEFTFKKDDAPVSVDSARLSFNMKMDMGPNDYNLIDAGNGRWLAKDVVLPTCPSGGRVWFGSLVVKQGVEEHQGRFRIELALPNEPSN